MSTFREYKRRTLLPLAGIGLASYYLLVFMPLSRHVQALDAPLHRDWRHLAASVGQSNALTLDFVQITNQLNETRQAVGVLEEAKRQAAARLELPASLRGKLVSPFQLVEYQIERSKIMDELDRQARDQKVAIDTAVYAGFPEAFADLKEPALLWPALSFTSDLLTTALRCKVSAIHSLEVSLALTNTVANENLSRWTPIPLQLEFTAPADNATRLIESLPLRADELKAASLPEVTPEKMPLFLDRLILKKQSPEKPDEVRVWLQAIGFVVNE